MSDGNYNLAFAVHREALQGMLSAFHASLPGGVFSFTVADLGLEVRLHFVQPMRASIGGKRAKIHLAASSMKVGFRFQGSSETVEIEASFQLGVDFVTAPGGTKSIAQLTYIDGAVPDDRDFEDYLEQEVFPKLIQVVNVQLASATFPPSHDKLAFAAPIIDVAGDAIRGFVALTGQTAMPATLPEYLDAQPTVWADAKFIKAVTALTPIHVPFNFTVSSLPLFKGSFYAVVSEVLIASAGAIALTVHMAGTAEDTGLGGRVWITAEPELIMIPRTLLNEASVTPKSLEWRDFTIVVEDGTGVDPLLAFIIEKSKPAVETGLWLAFEVFLKNKPLRYPLGPLCVPNGTGAMFIDFSVKFETVQRETNDFVARVGITPQVRYLERTKC
jgi:hypothetical protein